VLLEHLRRTQADAPAEAPTTKPAVAELA
jgi:hypothetical protein